MSDLVSGQRVRSYDFFPGDDLYVDGVLQGFALCMTKRDADGEPYTAYSGATFTRPEGCVHAVVLVEALSPAWNERGRFAHDEQGKVVYPALEGWQGDGMVVPLVDVANAALDSIADQLPADLVVALRAKIAVAS